MTELSGFSAVQKICADLAPQSLQVPSTKEDGIARAAAIFEGLWDAVNADLAPNVTIEILKHDGVTYCRITPWQADGITKTVANPGDWIAIDGSRILGMTNDAYTAQFTLPQEQPAGS
jgi:hypothetical protein